MSRNGRRRPPRPRIELSQSNARPEEAAAITAAIEQFLRDTAPPPTQPQPELSPWLRTALLENVGAAESGPQGWGDFEPWGR